MVVYDLDHLQAPPSTPYTSSDEVNVAFKMLPTNTTNALRMMDAIRRKPQKFICLNDNIDHSSVVAGSGAVVVEVTESQILLKPPSCAAQTPRGRGHGGGHPGLYGVLLPGAVAI